MTLDEKVRQKLTEWRPAAGRQELTVAGDGWRLHLTADKQDELGCLVWEMALRRLNVGSNDSLRAWADRITQHVTGLLEPLKVVEIDTERHEGLLRSAKPRQRNGQLFYYEVLLKGTADAYLRRYQAAEEGSARREQVAFALTHEAIAKLAGDLAAD